MAEYSQKQLIELSKQVFKVSPHETHVFAQANGTFLNQNQYNKLKKRIEAETDAKKRAAGQSHLDGMLKIDNPKSQAAHDLNAAAEAKKQAAAAEKAKALQDAEEKKKAEAEAKAKAKADAPAAKAAKAEKK